MTCPFCGSDRIELVSAWGGQIITSQVRCRSCGTYFEAVREDFDAGADTAREPGADQSRA
jgi:hypothetical protein